ncbi:MAG: L-histidine N(alpha)-methyltransferase [Solirubrobacterales bacterium]|nr:L-histidine N(alpha)-methyltransferase [Solirubrobacterales bacterium]
MAEDALDGLTRPFTKLPPEYFYDALGSELFDQLACCRSTARSMPRRRSWPRRPSVEALACVTELVERGSGSADEARLLLAPMVAAGTARRHIPVAAAEPRSRTPPGELIAEHPSLLIAGVNADFERQLHGVRVRDVLESSSLLGGTIGSFLRVPTSAAGDLSTAGSGGPARARHRCRQRSVHDRDRGRSPRKRPGRSGGCRARPKLPVGDPRRIRR